MDEASVERWERGKDLPQLPEFFALAEVFGWPIPRAIVKGFFSEPLRIGPYELWTEAPEVQ